MGEVISACRWIRTQVVQLNLFDNENTRLDGFHLRTAVISTRLYICLLTLAIAILVVNTAFRGQIKTVNIQNPSQATYEYLYSKYPTTLSCRCGRITIPYSAFISVSPQYHPICSSFFVSDIWIDELFDPNIGYFIQIDFRSSASGQFRLLSSLCSLAKRSVQDALESFLSDNLLTMYVLSAETLETQSHAQSLFVRISLVNAVRRLLNLIRDTTQSNRLQPGLQTTSINALYIYSDGVVASGVLDGIYLEADDNICPCSSTSTCSSPSAFFDLYAYETDGIFVSPTPPTANVSGFMAGCYAIESLFQSTLECFFDQICLSTLLTVFPISNITSVTPLIINRTLFLPETPIEILTNQLFIEQWYTLSSFSTYYKECAPVSCTYTFSERTNALYVLTSLVGLYGGLTFILRLCVPRAIGWWRNRPMRRIQIGAPGRLIERLRAAYQLVGAEVIQLNLFKTTTTPPDVIHLTTTRISTRVYLLMLCLSITTIVTFTALKINLQSVTIQNPSVETYKNMYNNHPTTLQCQCSQITIRLYISIGWIDSIKGTINLDFSYSYTDFHMVGQAFFTTLATLCSLAQSTLSYAWFISNTSAFITDQVLPPQMLMARASTILDQFQLNTVAEFKRALLLVRWQTQTLFSITRGNADLYTTQLLNSSTQGPERIDFLAVPTIYGSCSCALSDECQQQVDMYSNGNHSIYEVKFSIPNFFIGCFVIQSVLQSSLECFFNQTCLNAVQAEIYSNQSINVSVLDVRRTQFSPQTLIARLVDALMVEQWGQTLHYDQYYAQCAPNVCSYKFDSRDDALHVFTTLLGLVGGLTVALRVLVPLIVGWIRNRMLPTVEENNTIGRLYEVE